MHKFCNLLSIPFCVEGDRSFLFLIQMLQSIFLSKLSLFNTVSVYIIISPSKPVESIYDLNISIVSNLLDQAGSAALPRGENQ